MTVAIDVEQRRISASVGDLLEEASQRTIGLSGGGLSRLWIGQELHRRIQDELSAEEPDYRTEVPVAIELEIDGWTVAVTGRADGVLYEDDAAARVDEIKTLHFAVDLYNLYHQERLERFRQQVRLYAFMLCREGVQPQARLILVDIVSGEERTEEVSWSYRSTQAFLRQRVHRIVTAEHRRLVRAEELRESAAELIFPHPQRRPVQETIGRSVGEALEHGRNLLVRAPTGCGKTAAVLHPALKVALAKGKRLFFLTAKTLQQKIAVDTARAMQEGRFRSLQLRAKSKMCANTEIICHEEHCPYAREYGIKLVRSRLLENLYDESDHLDPDRIFAAARDHEVCPFEVSLDLLQEVDLVVCDYNYVFDPTIGLSALVNRDTLRNSILIIDEAHNLVDRSREYYSPALDSRTLAVATALLASRDCEVFHHLKTLVDQLGELIREVVSGAAELSGAEVSVTSLPEARIADLRLAFDGAMLEYFMYKRERELWMARDPVMDVFFALSRLHRVLTLGGEEFVHLASRSSTHGEQIKVFCCDASRFLGATLDESGGAVAMSATLEPFEFYRNLLGLDPHRSDELYVPSPFPPENRLVVTIDDVDTTFRHRRTHYDRIASWIARLAQPHHNVLTLFPSYAFLEDVRDRLPPVPHRVLVQQPGSSDADQQDFLAALSNGDPHLLLAVLGGIFAEGVDYPGQMLSQVIVVSPGLPQHNLERQLLKAYYAEQYAHGFAYAYLIPGLTRVVQAAGRLLRSEDDRGAIALIGRRFKDPRYSRLLPEEWTEDEPDPAVAEDPEGAVREFFS